MTLANKSLNRREKTKLEDIPMLGLEKKAKPKAEVGRAKTLGLAAWVFWDKNTKGRGPVRG